MKNNYRKIWESFNGPIPKDDDGRSYEIHHIDGNRDNNDISNLLCISIKNHYDIHYRQGDYGACVMIAKRMTMTTEEIRNIQLGKKRPGIGGVKKGTTPWNKGRTGYVLNLTEDGKKRKKISAKRNNKITDEISKKIKKDFIECVGINDERIGIVQQNGRLFTYERAFCLEYSKKYNVSDQYIYRIIKGKSKVV